MLKVIITACEKGSKAFESSAFLCLLKKIFKFESETEHPYGCSFAFTLAETLIVMGIIGVVAALTIPNLTQSTGDKEKVAKVKKLHSNLEDAYGRAMAVYGPVDTWVVNITDSALGAKKVADRIFEFMKITKYCDIGVLSTCFTQGKVKYLDGSNWGEVTTGNTPNAILADGSSLSIYLDSATCSLNKAAATSTDSPYNSICGTMYVDIDGPNKGPFVWGKDIFEFKFTKTGIFPSGSSSYSTTSTDALLKTNCLTTGLDCTGWVIENGNLDYLKATNGTCPNGTTLNWTNTTCK